MFPCCVCNALILPGSIFDLSLHHGVAWCRRWGRVEVGDADGAQQAAARWVPVVTERFVVPLPRSMSTTRMDLRIVKASVAERSRREDFSFFSMARWSRKASAATKM